MSIAKPSLRKRKKIYNTHTHTQRSRSAVLLLQLSQLSISRGSRRNKKKRRAILTDTFATSALQFVWQRRTMRPVFVSKHIVPISPVELAKHEMTVEADRGAFCLQTRWWRRQRWRRRQRRQWSGSTDKARMRFQPRWRSRSIRHFTCVWWYLHQEPTQKWSPVLLLWAN